MHHQRTHTATLSAMLDNAAPSELHELIRHALRFDSHELAPVVARLELDFDIGAVASSSPSAAVGTSTQRTSISCESVRRLFCKA